LVSDQQTGRQQFIFTDPRRNLRNIGVIPGMIQFDGKREGNWYRGSGYSYSENCGAQEFKMNGRIVNDSLIKLYGPMALVDPRTCKRADNPPTREFDFERIDGAEAGR
jgi:hypothetical protein